MAIAINTGFYSDISDYSSLVEKVKLWIDRGDLDQLIPTFIGNTESYLNRTLRTPEMELTAPVQSMNGAFGLPIDCLQVRGVTAGGRPIQATSPAALNDAYIDASGALVAGRAMWFAISGRQVRTAPLGDDALVLSYWQRIPALSLNQPNNWLLDSHPDVYLYGALFHANTYTVDTDAAANWSTLFENAAQGVQDAGAKARFGGPIVARPGVRQVRGIRA